MRHRRKEGEEEGGSRKRFEEGGEGEDGTSGVQINCIPLWVLPGNHTQHAHAVHMLCLPPQQSLRSGAAHTGHCCLCATSCSMGCLPIAVQWPVAPALRTAPSSG